MKLLTFILSFMNMNDMDRCSKKLAELVERIDTSERRLRMFEARPDPKLVVPSLTSAKQAVH